MKTKWGAIAGMFLSGCGEEVDRIDLSEALGLVGSSEVVGVTYTVFEPFDHEGRAVHCGDMGVFRPSRLYDRRYNSVPGIWSTVLENRLFEVPTALSGDWSIRFPREEIENNFGGVMYHFEVRALAAGSADIDGRRAAVQDETILEACTCLADSPHQLYRWRDSNDCVPRFDLDGPIPATLAPVAPAEFVLQEPPLTSLSLSDRGDVLLDPGLVIANVDPDACRTDRCDDLSLVPVSIELEGAGPDSGVRIDPEHEVLVTDEDGRVVPRLQVDDCQEDFALKATVVGAEAGVTVNVRCG